MMENHSYDNYFGMLEGRGEGFSRDSDGHPIDPNQNKDFNGHEVALFHASSTEQHDGVPSQSWAATHFQWANGACDGFVKSLEETLTTANPNAGMAYFDEDDLPFYYSLAKTFPLASHWFSSCLGPTFPNRRFLISGTAHGLIDDFELGLTDYPPAGTIFDLLTAHGISWVNYHNKPPARTLVKSLLGKRGLIVSRWIGLFFSGFFPQLEQFLIGELQFCADMYPRGLLRTLNHARPLKEFFDSAKAGTLPSIAIVDPDYGKFSEEDPQDVQIGESFAASVINAVVDGKGWPDTLLIWLYDEHGGYYDHVAPPPAPSPDDVPARSLFERHSWLARLPVFKKMSRKMQIGDAGPRTYDHFGFRVPAVIVSPYARPDFVSSTVFDHTSILKLIEEKWNIPALTRRDAQAIAPLEMIDLSSPPAFLNPPFLSSPARPGIWETFLR